MNNRRVSASSTDIETPPDTHPWTTLSVTTAIQALVSMAALTMPVLAALIGPSVGGAPSVLAGLFAGAMYLGATVSTLVGGPLVLRWGAIRVSQIGLVLCAAGLALGALGVLPVMALGAFVVGLGYGPITPASSHLLVKSAPPAQMSLVFSIKQTGVPLGGLLAGAVAPGLGLAAGWQMALAALAVPCILLAGFSQPLRRRLDTDRDVRASIQWQAIAGPIGMVVKHATLRRLAFCSQLFTVTQLSVAAYSVTYLHETLGMDLVLAGMILSVAQAGGVAGRIAWGYVADAWLGARATIAALAALMALGAFATAALQAATPVWVVLLVMLAFGTAAIGWNGVYLAEVARAAPAGMAGTATGGTLGFTFLANVLGPAVLGVVIQHLGGLRTAYALLGIPLLITCAIFLRKGQGRA